MKYFRDEPTHKFSQLDHFYQFLFPKEEILFFKKVFLFLFLVVVVVVKEKEKKKEKYPPRGPKSNQAFHEEQHKTEQENSYNRVYAQDKVQKLRALDYFVSLQRSEFG